MFFWLYLPVRGPQVIWSSYFNMQFLCPRSYLSCSTGMSRMPQWRSVFLVSLACSHEACQDTVFDASHSLSCVPRKPNAFLTVFRTLLKYIKLTATAMVWRRTAASKMSPRLWTEMDMAISHNDWIHQEKKLRIKKAVERGRSSSVAFLLCRTEREREGGKVCRRL